MKFGRAVRAALAAGEASTAALADRIEHEQAYAVWCVRRGPGRRHKARLERTQRARVRKWEWVIIGEIELEFLGSAQIDPPGSITGSDEESIRRIRARSCQIELYSLHSATGANGSMNIEVEQMTLMSFGRNSGVFKPRFARL